MPETQTPALRPSASADSPRTARPDRRARVSTAVARRIVGLRQEVRRYRRLSAGLAAVALAALLVAGLSVAADDGAEPVTLGTGVAGVAAVGDAAPGTEDLVDVPADFVPPPPADERVGRALGEGAASYYHDALEGRSTASGEPYRRESLTAAHRSLPFGSKVRVTHLANARSIVVRINDRGPYSHGRVIDLSRAAAKELGLLARGHGRVRLELLHD